LLSRCVHLPLQESQFESRRGDWKPACLLWSYVCVWSETDSLIGALLSHICRYMIVHVTILQEHVRPFLDTLLSIEQDICSQSSLKLW